MPAKNSVKEFVEDSYYHLYNRGVEKRTIFVDEQDAGVFLSYLKTYLMPKNEASLRQTALSEKSSWRQKEEAKKLLLLNNFADTVVLCAYCLMPNHFHFLIKQTDADTIDRFMNSLCTRYTMYFNRKYRRVGPLYQGLYKAVRVVSEEQLLHLSRYIHRNPASRGTPLRSYSKSSYPQYLGLVKVSWVHPELILNYFPKSRTKEYEQFVELTDADEELAAHSPILLDADN